MAYRHDQAFQSFPHEGRPTEARLEEAIGRDPVLAHLLPRLKRLAAADAPVLIVGEAGERVARAIHNLSGRASHPFVLIDCASLSPPLIEVELLGVDGSPPHKMGIFEQAGAGTVLLAEVGELPLRLQEAVLVLLERHEVVPLNSQTPISAPARCLASTSIDLRMRVSAGLFRGDLHARLAAELLVIPPLRERPQEVVGLGRHFCAQLACGAREFTPEAEDLLRAYPWPGDVRELREVVEQAALGARGEQIGVEDLPPRLRGEPHGGRLDSLRDVERRHIERVLQEARGNQRRASRILGISRWSLSRRLQKYGMRPRGEGPASPRSSSLG